MFAVAAVSCGLGFFFGWSASGLLCVVPSSDFRLIYCGILTIPDSIHRGQSEGVYCNRLSERASNTGVAQFCLSQVFFGALSSGAGSMVFACWHFVLLSFCTFVLLNFCTFDLGIAICDYSVGSHHIFVIPWVEAAREAFVFFPAHPPFCWSVVWCLPVLLSRVDLASFHFWLSASGFVARFPL